MTEGVERAAKRRMRPVGFHMTIYNLLKIWKAKTLKETNRWLVVFVKEALKLWRIYVLGSRGGYLTKFNTGRLRPEVQPLTLSYTILAEKVPLL